MSGATGTELMVRYASRFYCITFLGGVVFPCCHGGRVMFTDLCSLLSPRLFKGVPPETLKHGLDLFGFDGTFWILIQYLWRTNMFLWQRHLCLYVGGVGSDRRGHCPVHNWLTQLYRVFLCGHGGGFKPACCRPTNTSASRHRGDHKDFSVWNTVGLWRWVVAEQEVRVELTANDLHVQSGGTVSIFWATRQM